MLTLESQLLLLALIAGYAVLLYRTRQNSGFIRGAALVILLSGTALNMYGLSMETYQEGIVAEFFRALIMSMRMFIYDMSLLEIEEVQREPYFLELYMLVFYAASLTSISAIIMIFGKRAMTVMSLSLRQRSFDHVFIGINNRSEDVSRGITDGSIAFIEFPDEAGERKVSVSGVLKGISGEEKKGGHRNANATVLYAKRKLTLGRSGPNVFKSIGLEKLSRLVTPATAFYILSEDSERNLDELMTLLGDESLIKNTIHVCLSREGVSRYYKTTLKGTGVHFIYPSSMSVVEMMTTPSCHPASVMKAAADGPLGTVEQGLNALVIGFGETGRAVTKFLYEFSSAVGPDGKAAPTSIVVCDSRIDRLKGPFFFDNPGLENSPIISYENCGSEDSRFWNMIVERLDSLNYIAISMRDDAENLDMACTIFMYAMKKRKGGLEGLRIVVRKRTTLPHERKLVEKMNEKAGREVIVCYGEHEKVFTAEKIVSKGQGGINRKATSLADRISEAYGRVKGAPASAPAAGSTASAKAPGSGGQAAGSTASAKAPAAPGSFHAKASARMETHQMISRANHIASLRMLIGEDPSSAGSGVTNLSAESLEALAKAEHLRYARYLIAHGYSPADEDDDVFKTNHQICDWECLSEEDKQYHRDMLRAQLEA